MHDFKKGDTFSVDVEFITYGRTRDECLVIPTSGANRSSFYTSASSLKNFRFPKIDLATCDIGDGVRVCWYHRPGEVGTMIFRFSLSDGKIMALVVWDDDETNIYPVDDLVADYSNKSIVNRNHIIKNYIDGYSYRSDEGDYDPEGGIVAILEDFAHGLAEALVPMIDHSESHNRPDKNLKKIAEPPAPTCPPGHVMINGHAVPEPMREPPTKGERYFVVTISDYRPTASIIWNWNERDTNAFKQGLCHATREAAQKHFDALIAPTKRDYV